MVNGVDRVLQWYDLNSQDGDIYFRLNDDKGTRFAESLETYNGDKVAVRDFLEENLKLLSPGAYVLQVITKATDKNAGKRTKFIIERGMSSTLSSIGAPMAIQQGGGSFEQIEARIAEMQRTHREELKATKLEWELERAKEKIDALESELSQREGSKPFNAIGSFINTHHESIAQLLPLIANKFFGNAGPVAMAGWNGDKVSPLSHEDGQVDNTTAEEITEAQQAVINDLLDVLYEQTKGDTDRVFTILSNLSQYLKNNPSTLPMVEGMIKPKA